VTGFCRVGKGSRMFLRETCPQINHQSGASLIELMLAVALSAFLMLGFIQVYLSVNKTFSLQQEVVNIQENARFSVHFLSENIREAGYANCDGSPDFTNPDLAIQGYQTTLPSYLQGKVLKDTDSIVIGRCVLQNGKTQFIQTAFFIGATTRKNKLGKTIYALYEMPINSSRRELVSGVENMAFTYGIAKPDTADIFEYLPADKVTDWRAVRGVEIALLLNSEAPVLKTAASYTFAGKIFPADRFLHREWSMYVALREF